MTLRNISFAKCLINIKINPILRNISNSCSLFDKAEKMEKAKAFQKQMDEKYPDFRIAYGGMPYEPVDVHTSILYMKSREYDVMYKGEVVWFYYRRNFKGHFPPKKLRRNCVYFGLLSTKHACPICRDNHLVLDYRNTELLQQFVDRQTGIPFPNNVTNLCLKQNENLLFHLEVAYQLGLMQKSIPIRLYDYTEYYSQLAPEIKDYSVPYTTTMEVLPNAVRLFSKSNEASEIERPAVPNRYALEEKRYLDKRDAKMKALKLNLIKK